MFSQLSLIFCAQYNIKEKKTVPYVFAHVKLCQSLCLC